MLINNALGHRVISFLDGIAGYNQNFMSEEDVLVLSAYLNGLL
jgi:hypothetical protein